MSTATLCSLGVLFACAPQVGTPELVDPGDLHAEHRDPWHATLAEAGVVEMQVQVGETTLRYAEGPDNGPPLLLLHAQHMDWFSYSRVLPELSQSFHVFAVSYHGHGDTQAPPERLNAGDIGQDLSAFIEHVIGEPVYLSGNSSGALLSLWLAAESPQWVRAVVLEDPPLFTSELPRSKQTVAYRSFTTCHDFLSSGETDFLSYWLEDNRPFIEKQVGKLGYSLLVHRIQRYREDHPGEPLELTALPDTIRLLIRGLAVYDPHFGAAFYDGSWSAGFDQAQALAKVSAPTLLLHANFEVLDDGTLNGALDDADAARAVALLSDGSYQRVDAEHVVHLDSPETFIRVLQEAFDRP
ncbi:MAG: alpha/beta hydrolase [Myxococcota bacterium]|nr:alpha/beta hydrolase [Myxococcota bacterium]